MNEGVLGLSASGILVPFKCPTLSVVDIDTSSGLVIDADESPPLKLGDSVEVIDLLSGLLVSADDPPLPKSGLRG